MPRELRQILFNMDELLSAVIAYNRMAQEKVIYGDPIKCVIGKNGEISLESRIKHGDNWKEMEVVLGKKVINDSIIRFCIENNVMIPKAGKKSFGINRDELCLLIELDR